MYCVFEGEIVQVIHHFSVFLSRQEVMS